MPSVCPTRIVLDPKSGNTLYNLKYSIMSRRLRLLQPITLAFALLLGFNLSKAGAVTPDHWTYVDADGVTHTFGKSDACDNVTDGGLIGNDITGCANPTYQPPTLVNVALPSGGSGDLEFIWMTTMDDPAGSGAVSWSLIPGSTQVDYTPVPIAQTAYYMRCSRRAGCTEYTGETNYVTVLIDCCDNATDGGVIAGNQTACGIPFDPALITNVSPASGGSNAMLYAWYTSTTTNVFMPGSADWTLVTGVITPYYNPPSVSEVTHFVRVAQREFCSDIGAYSNVITVSAHPVPTLKADTVGVTCFGDSDGSATITIIDAAQPFTYRWLDNNSTQLVRTGMAAGSYQFEITDGNGCVGVEDVVIPSPAELVIGVSADFDVCNFNDDAELTANVTGGTEPYTYLWNTGATTAVITNQAAGTYRVDVTDANGCTSFATVDVNPPVALTASATTVEPVCYQDNGEISVVAAGGVAPYTYAWMPNVSTSASASNLAGGDYSIVVTDDNGCTSTVNVSLIDETPITIDLRATPISCFGTDDAEITATVRGGVSPYLYRWTAPNGSTLISESISNAGPGVWELEIEDANGCLESAQITIVEPVELEVLLDVTQPLCFEDGGTIVIDINGGAGTYTWDWNGAAPDNSTVLTGLAAGDYQVDVTDADGCTATATATIETTVLMELSVSSNPATCPGEEDGDATVVVTGGEPGYTYLWNGDASLTTATITNQAGGSYTVEVTDTRGCVKSATVVIDNLSTGPIIDAELTELDCFGGTEAAIDLTISGGLAPYTFDWGVGQPTTEDRNNLPAGTYEVTVTDAAGCEATAQYTFEDPEELMCSAEATSTFLTYFNVSRFGATDGVATVTTTGGVAPFTYAWTNGTGGATATGLPGGLTEVTVTDANGCTCMTDVELEEPSMISDFVFEDEDGDGIQDPTELGLQGVDITLTGTDFNGIAVNFTATSDAQGAYRFDQLPMGTYFMIFELPNFQDYLHSPVDQGGDDALDSDMDPITGSIQRTVSAHGVGDYDTDAGYIPRESVITIGDRIWYDENHDGIQDPFEIDLQGVTVNLIRSTDGLQINSTRTNEDGNYYFYDVAPGSYHITIDQTTSTVAAAFIITRANEGNDESLDSDLDPITMRSDDIEVTPTSQDIDFVDVGLHENCGEVDQAGVIAGDEDVCRGDTPAPITSVSTPSGAVEYRWMRSNNTQYRGPNDPNWVTIPGATGPSYQPSSLPVTVRYIRLARVAGCLDFTGASNIITKTVIPLPLAEISSGRQTFCRSQALDVSADSTAPAVFEWDFGADATPQFATGRVVTGVTYSLAGTRFIYLTVTNAAGCVGRDSLQINTLNCFGPGDINGLTASGNTGANTLRWSALSLYDGSYFDIERAVAGGAFETIESVDCIALGTWADYTYVDAFAPSGLVTYRVLHRAPQADDAMSREVSLEAEQHALLTSLYPNPAHDVVTMEVAAAVNEASEVLLVNAYGKTVWTQSLAAGRHEVDVRELPAGTYYLRVVTADGVRDTRTLIKY